MSEVQAIETEEEVEIEEVLEEQESDEVEIVIDGEEQPSSAPRISGFNQRINKLNGKVSAANEEVEALKLSKASVEEQNKLLRQQLEAKASLKRPKLEDFESDAEYERALDEYDEQRTTAAVQKQTEKLLSESQSQSSHQIQSTNLNANLKAHYERADKLKVKDYTEVEDVAISILGNDITKQIMASTDNSEVILFHLGKNPQKAEQIAYLVANGDPMKAAVEIGGLSKSLTLKPKTSTAPSPETAIEPGSGSVSASEKKLDAMRAKVSEGKANFSDLMALKRQLGAK